MGPDLVALTHHDVLPGGEHVVIRPLKPADGALYPEFLAHVAPDDMRLRFFAAVKDLSQERISELTHLDYARAMAFIAVDEAAGHMLGVVRLHLDNDRRAGEFAVIVRSQLKGHGLGWVLMQRMIDYAHVVGLAQVHGQVLAENTTMLRICSEFGFRIEENPKEMGVKVVRLSLSGMG